jgi:hypothetical protein
VGAQALRLHRARDLEPPAEGGLGIKMLICKHVKILHICEVWVLKSDLEIHALKSWLGSLNEASDGCGKGRDLIETPDGCVDGRVNHLFALF